MSDKRKQGELESQIMGCLWDRPDGLSSQQILALMGDEQMAITTVLTVLSRLGAKGMVFKQKLTGRTFIFRSAKSREEHTAALLLGALDQSADPALVFSHFASGLSPDQIASLKKALNSG
jgi:predicted transcriptional regulator